MRIINKKYLLIVLLVGVILTGVIVLKPKEEVKLDNVILKQEVNNKTFAMYREEGENNYVEVEGNKFPDMYVLNIEKSKCIDNNGKELENVLSYENDKVTITSGNTTYCYLYFDKSLGLEIKEKNPNRLSTDKIRGAMFRFQGQYNEDVQNYICFGTSDKEKCVTDTDHHMYRIIGIEAETGRVKVIKQEALNETYQWWTNTSENIAFPQSLIYKAIKGAGFLTNTEYVPNSWEEKIANNTWTYGNMGWSEVKANQTVEELYLVETGQKETSWTDKANEEDEGAQSGLVGNHDSSHYNQPTYYIRHTEKWNKKFDSKISLMYLHDYYYSVSDDARPSSGCELLQNGWMRLSQNDSGAPSIHEWTMVYEGFNAFHDVNIGLRVVGSCNDSVESYLINAHSIRPVFYLASVNQLSGGRGTSDDPFIIN